MTINIGDKKISRIAIGQGDGTTKDVKQMNLGSLVIFKGNVPSGDGTLSDLKKALQTGHPEDYYPVGTKLKDKWNNEDNSIIVTQYLNSSNNEQYYGAEGVLFIREFIDPSTYGYWPVDYSTSNINEYLNGEYLDKCSEEMKNIISEINIPYFNGSGIIKVPTKWFLMSDYEICSNRGMRTEGIMWDYWKNKTGLQTPNYGANSGRIVNNINQTASFWWIRSRASNDLILRVSNNGDINSIGMGYNSGILPAGFISK